MGSLIGNPAKRASFSTQLYPTGIDLTKSELPRVLGVWKAASGTTFRAGQAVMLNSNGEVVVSDGTSILGIAKWDKVTLGRSLEIDEEVTFGVSDASKSLKRSNLVSGSVVVRSAVEGGGTTYTVTTDYTIDLNSGVITHVETGGAIDEANPVYVSYAWSFTEEDYEFQGKNFWQSADYVTIQDGHVAVIQNPAQIFTAEFDQSQAYALSGANSNIYINANGNFTSSSAGSAKLVGKCINVPSASDPALGVDFHGQVVAST